jgi:hypothetical protein
LWIGAGYEPDDFWNRTLLEIGIFMRAFQGRMEREQHGRAWQAWHMAVLSRWDGRKKFPSFEVFAGTKKQAKAQTPEQLEAAGRALFAAWGGVTDGEQ